MRLTSTGKVRDAVISPDGRYVGYVQEDSGHRLVQGAGGERGAVRHPRQTGDLARVAGELPDEPEVGAIPHLDGVIVGASRQKTAIRGEDDVRHVIAIAGQGGNQGALLDAPDLHLASQVAGRDVPAVRRPGDRVNAHLVRIQAVPQGARGGVPDAHCAVLASGCDKPGRRATTSRRTRPDDDRPARLRRPRCSHPRGAPCDRASTMRSTGHPATSTRG
jgi:hypothetical protein